MEEDQMDWLFDFLARLGEGIQAVIGPGCEVVVHDFRSPEHSVVAVAGDLTGRQPGAPIPDLAFMADGMAGAPEDEINYRSLAAGRTFQSSTVWIRNQAQQTIGAVCINVDFSHLLRARKLLDRWISPALDQAPPLIQNTFARDLNELIEQAIAQFLRQEDFASLASLPTEDKRALVQHLEDRGLFRIRGAVDHLADLLGVSRATIYNYRSRMAEAADGMVE